MLYVHGQEDVGVTKQLCDVKMRDSSDGFLGVILKMLFSCFLAEIILSYF